jgi:cbb3-type cytochrome oxidase cytochrome c subunit
VLIAAAALAGGCAHGQKTATRISLQAEAREAVPGWAQRQGFAGNRRAIAGARLFVLNGCMTCHTYLGTGSANLGASDLTSVGRKHSIRFFRAYTANPEQFGNLTMPRFAPLGGRRLTNLAIFLKASKGPR